MSLDGSEPSKMNVWFAGEPWSLSDAGLSEDTFSRTGYYDSHKLLLGYDMSGKRHLKTEQGSADKLTLGQAERHTERSERKPFLWIERIT